MAYAVALSLPEGDEADYTLNLNHDRGRSWDHDGKHDHRNYYDNDHDHEHEMQEDKMVAPAYYDLDITR